MILPKDSSFCDGVDTFTRLLQVDSAIAIESGTLLFEGNFRCDFKVVAGEIATKEQRFFHMRLTAQVEEDSYDSAKRFTTLLKKVRTILSKAGGLIETLWDDISFLYSRKAYEQIYRIENLMRKLIANFMLTTIGKEWLAETSPSEVRDVISKSKRIRLRKCATFRGFIHLADFLIKPYSSKSTQELHTQLANASDADDLATLQQYIPTSNWQRYFSSLVNCEDSYLNKRWAELYDLRCKVAHNAIITKTDLDRINELVSDLQIKLEEAIQKLPQVSVPQEEQELVAESAAISFDALVGEFIASWRLLQKHLLLYSQRSGSRAHVASRQLLLFLYDNGLITEDIRRRLIVLQQFRNKVVHDPDFSLTETEMRYQISEAVALREIVDEALCNSPEIEDP